MKPYIPYFIIAALVVALMFSIKGCNDNKQSFTDLSNYQANLNDSVRYYQGKAGTIVAYKQQLDVTGATLKEILAENQDLKNKLADMKIPASKVQEITVVVNHETHDTIKVALHDTIQGRKYVPWDDSTRYFHVGGLVNNQAVIVSTHDFPDSLTIVSQSTGSIFSKPRFTLKVSHSNPFVSTTGIENIVVRANTPFYKKPGVLFCAGILAGYIIDRKVLRGP